MIWKKKKTCGDLLRSVRMWHLVKPRSSTSRLGNNRFKIPLVIRQPFYLLRRWVARWRGEKKGRETKWVDWKTSENTQISKIKGVGLRLWFTFLRRVFQSRHDVCLSPSRSGQRPCSPTATAKGPDVRNGTQVPTNIARRWKKTTTLLFFFFQYFLLTFYVFFFIYLFI